MKSGGASSVLLILYSLICIAQTQSQANCGIQRFRCQNGECIDSERLCDGKSDCRDSSDETRSECSGPQIVCPQYAFKCAYGACIDGDKTCDGIQDCVDNSDETLPRCGLASNDTKSPGQCSTYQFRCDNGQCIADTALCDGNVDCADSSDETADKCSAFVCPQLVFRCSYGACIDGDKKCNGERNCADGSDEDPSLCSSVPSKPWTVTPSYTPTPTPTPSSRPTLSHVTPSRQSCIVPPQPENGHWKLHRSQCNGEEDCDLGQGVQLQPGAYLIYSCNSGYRVKGTVHVFCGPQGQWLNIPTCEEIMCRALSTASTNADCTHNDEWKSCESPVKPRTRAKLTCRNSYRQETSVFSSRRDVVRCNDNGQWEPDPIRCVPECGLVAPNLIPTIVNGSRAEVSEFPWHATLYKTATIGAPKEFICGATIIQANLLITAAHCVFDESNKVVEDPRNFFVATGNIFRDYDSPWHNQYVKKAEVKNVYVVCDYLGFEGNFAWDIAIIELVKPFVLSSVLLPACLDIHTASDQVALEAGNLGKIAGFGRTAQGKQSGVLQAISVPYIPINQCRSTSILHESTKFITLDKFCAGYTNGTSVCDGDSGGGLLFKTDGLWYIRGVVSLSLGETNDGTERYCDSHSYALYTRISSHIGWIQDVILRLETLKSFPSCPRRRT